MNPRGKGVRSKPYASLQQGRRKHRAGKLAKATGAVSKAHPPTAFVAEKPGEQQPQKLSPTFKFVKSQAICQVSTVPGYFENQTQGLSFSSRSRADFLEIICFGSEGCLRQHCLFCSAT